MNTLMQQLERRGRSDLYLQEVEVSRALWTQESSERQGVWVAADEREKLFHEEADVRKAVRRQQVTFWKALCRSAKEVCFHGSRKISLRVVCHKNVQDIGKFIMCC